MYLNREKVLKESMLLDKEAALKTHIEKEYEKARKVYCITSKNCPTYTEKYTKMATLKSIIKLWNPYI